MMVNRLFHFFFLVNYYIIKQLYQLTVIYSHSSSYHKIISVFFCLYVSFPIRIEVWIFVIREFLLHSPFVLWDSMHVVFSVWSYSVCCVYLLGILCGSLQDCSLCMCLSLPMTIFRRHRVEISKWCLKFKGDSLRKTKLHPFFDFVQKIPHCYW